MALVATVHFGVWLSLFRSAFAAIDAGQSFRFLPALALNILGAPLMFVLYLPPSSVSESSRWWGDDASFIIGLGVLNSLFWGFILVWAYRSIRRLRNRRSHAA